jgi:NHS family xanthosine MFS transporter
MMKLKPRLAVMLFLQFFVWGSWMPTMAAWWFGTKHWSGVGLGAVFSTMGIAALFMPAIMGVIADRWMNAEKVYGISHIISALILFNVPMAKDPQAMFVMMLTAMCFYMPTIGLSFSVSYSIMRSAGMDVIKEFPPVRTLGTVGFIIAMWTVSLLRIETSAMIFYVAGIAGIVLGLYSFTMPKCPPLGQNTGSSFLSKIGLDAFKLFKDPKMALFFIFVMLLGAALQLTNAYGDAFLHSFNKNPLYEACIAVKYPAIIMSISQIAEVFGILFIPFFLKKFGIKKVIMMSMFAWVLRFGLFGFGNPGSGLWMIILSCIVYGVAFDFFNVSGSLYVDTQVKPSIRSSAQGLWMLMVNGLGIILGTIGSGWAVDKFFTIKGVSEQEVIIWQGWHGIWIAFAAYALIIGILFTILFKHKHDPNVVENIKH